ncbi:tetratricopeptide repeat protein [Streptomyces sp. LaPpAH-108]|uniref:tetratricopeptide repeat protein n=1 Tax=Streptomyces sp. LaPpAH-108 TaxID=1155714 RepID=UPI0003653DC9|nr:tetratricopeptide repeat protein [Streptomyces sp. LaPpAH-108]
MVRERPSMQELIGRRRRAGFVGRGGERAAFRENLDLSPEDERHRFLFHVHGNAGVGKTFLVRELEQIARERGALTAYVDESAGSVPEVLAEISRECARQGREFKRLDRALASYRERRHEAEAVAAGLDSAPEGPSPVTSMAVRAGLAGLGLVPGAGPFVGAVDAARLSQYADRLRRGLSARFGNQDDVQLVLSPERALTPKLLDELADVASDLAWIVLAFDTYERSGPFLDAWLHDLMTTDRYGALPAHVIVLTAGQHPFDTARWGGFADFMTEVPLGPFTEAEARGLLADRGVVAEPVVAEVLRLTGGLPLLVSTLAEQRPVDLDDVGDPSATAVERFLKWEPDAVRRGVALACAVPRGLDMDVFRAVVGGPEEEADGLFAWLRGLPFVDDRGDRLRYHDLVRGTMLRLQRGRSPQGWRERHERLAGVYGGWCEDAAVGIRPVKLWSQQRWRELRLEQTYHLLCARPHTELAGALKGLIAACRKEQADGRRWAHMLEEAGFATDDAELRGWGRRLRVALADERQGVIKAMDLLLSRPGLDAVGWALAHGLKGRELRRRGEWQEALGEYDKAITFSESTVLPDADLAVLYTGRGLTHQRLADTPSALADLDRADTLCPDDVAICRARGGAYRRAGRYEEAEAEFDRAIALNPVDHFAVVSRGVCRHMLGRLDKALADFDRALVLNSTYAWALVRRSRLHRDRGDWEASFADLDQAVSLQQTSAWVASERGDAYRLAGRYEEAVIELSRAVELQSDHASALASRGAAHLELGQYEMALEDLNRAVEVVPGYSWALGHRGLCKRELGDEEGALADLRQAAEADTNNRWIHRELGDALRHAGQYREALPALQRALELDSEDAHTLAILGSTHRLMAEYTEAFQYLDRALTLAPEYGWALIQRVLAAQETGRVTRAFADLDRCIALEPIANWARSDVVELLIRCGRWPEALERLAEAERLGISDENWGEQRAEAYRHMRQWTAAVQEAERMQVRYPLAGTAHMALAVTGSQGARSAERLWRGVPPLLEPGSPQAPIVRCLVGCALGEWDSADSALAEALSRPAWDDLALLADDLTELLNAPGADRSRLIPRLAAVTNARDAVQSRYAE